MCNSLFLSRQSLIEFGLGYSDLDEDVSRARRRNYPFDVRKVHYFMSTTTTLREWNTDNNVVNLPPACAGYRVSDMVMRR